jgi:aminoglycoside 2'-N-acetyltransferase I
MASVRVLRTHDAAPAWLDALRRMVVDAFDGEFTADDWEHALGGWHVVVEEDGVQLAHAAVVPRTLDVGDRPIDVGYLEAVATVRTRQREGLGTLAVRAAAEVLQREFAMGGLSTGEHDFYARLGWERWRGESFVRDGDTVTRTVEDDDSIMVLRYGPSRDVDVSASITCTARPGDAW